MTLLIIDTVTGLAGLALLLCYPIGDAWAKYRARKIMRNLVIKREK